MTNQSQFTLAYLPASDNGLSFRGSEVALLDYMTFSESILGHKSILCLGKSAYCEPSVLKLFAKFQIVRFENAENLESSLLSLGVHALYTMRATPINGLKLKKIPMLVHAVYNMNPSGNELVCAGVSQSVAEADVRGDKLFVPHMINLAESSANYRSALSIPANALVIGRHGGADTWDLPMAKEALLCILAKRDDVWFLFAVRPIILQDIAHPRVICLECFADPIIKRKFINTLDAFLHAQSMGETFGLSCGEASTANKPVITWNGGRCQEHLRILGNKCIKYNSADELFNILMKLDRLDITKHDWKAYDEYSPAKVMSIFDRVFIGPLRKALARLSNPAVSHDQK
jgi:hypothetical protein